MAAVSQAHAAITSTPAIEPATAAPLTDLFGAISLVQWHRKHRGRTPERLPRMMEEIAPSIRRKVRTVLYKRVRRENPGASRREVLARIEEIQSKPREYE